MGEFSRNQFRVSRNLKTIADPTTCLHPSGYNLRDLPKRPVCAQLGTRFRAILLSFLSMRFGRKAICVGGKTRALWAEQDGGRILRVYTTFAACVHRLKIPLWRMRFARLRPLGRFPICVVWT